MPSNFVFGRRRSLSAAEQAVAITESLVRTHNAAIEEAAKVAEAGWYEDKGGHRIAEDIRKLKRAP